MPTTQEYIAAVDAVTETIDMQIRREDRHRWLKEDYELAKRELERMLASTKPIQYRTPYN